MALKCLHDFFVHKYFFILSQIFRGEFRTHKPPIKHNPANESKLEGVRIGTVPYPCSYEGCRVTYKILNIK
jgi:hypothetical protein